VIGRCWARWVGTPRLFLGTSHVAEAARRGVTLSTSPRTISAERRLQAGRSLPAVDVTSVALSRWHGGGST
jgi:hypothetical protein